MIRNLQELYRYRALLWSLTQRELKARYRGSVLGFFWTFLNPALLMLVYALVFSVYMRQKIPNYPYFMFVGLLPWIWFSTSIGAGASTISDRRDLLTKVRFPAQVLPATVVATNLVNFLLSVPLMLALGAFVGVWPTIHLVVFPLIVAIQLLFILALAYIISALNVVFRDLQHIVGNLLTLWFFLTPVLYTASTIPERYRELALWLNPMAIVINAYQAILYDHQWPDVSRLAFLGALALLLLAVAAELFESRREEFAELI
ncbi:MAG: ABC transporter permease [Myxococcaceae bacterium]